VLVPQQPEVLAVLLVLLYHFTQTFLSWMAFLSPLALQAPMRMNFGGVMWTCLNNSNLNKFSPNDLQLANFRYPTACFREALKLSTFISKHETRLRKNPALDCVGAISKRAYFSPNDFGT